ncbi:DNA replication complex GINS protein PSF1 [Mortierella sp. AD031]|nr:DNA replication complex GINS protein PSF1 [Mortierella sp. AD031]
MYGEEASKLARETKRTIDHFPPYNDSLVRSITREIRHLHETCQSLIREFEAQKEHEGREYARRLDVLYGRPSGLDGAGSRAAQSGAGSSLGATALNQSTTTLAASGAAACTTPSFSSLPRPSQQSLHAAKEDRLKELAQVFWTKYHVHETPLQRNKRILMAYHHQRLEKIKELAWAYNTLPDTLRRLLSPDEIHFFQEYERTCRNKYCSLAEFGEIDLGLGMISPPKEVFITVRVIKDCGDIVTETGAVLSLKKNSEHFVKRGDVERLITQGYLLHVA